MKYEEEDIVVCELSTTITNLPSSKNNNLPINASFITSLFQQANQQVRKRKKE
jgi:hypothetical protein